MTKHQLTHYGFPLLGLSFQSESEAEELAEYLDSLSPRSPQVKVERVEDTAVTGGEGDRP